MGERDRETERQRDRETERQRDRERKRERQTDKRDSDGGRERERDSDGGRERERDSDGGRERGIQTAMEAETSMEVAIRTSDVPTGMALRSRQKLKPRFLGLRRCLPVLQRAHCVCSSAGFDG